MGFSWALSGRVGLKPAEAVAYRRAKVSPSDYDDWPDDWPEPGCDVDAMTVDAILAAYAAADAAEITWGPQGLDARAVFSNDSDCWLTYRSHLAAAVRAAARFGGTAEVAITGYIDGGPSSVFQILARSDGTSALEVLTARDAEPISARVVADVDPLVKAMVERFQSSKKPVSTDGAVDAIHARVCAELRACDPASVMSNLQRDKELMAHPKTKTVARLGELFPDARSYIDALESAWKDHYLPGKSAIMALRLLGRVSPERGAELARSYMAATGSSAALTAVKSHARSMLRPLVSPKEAASAIRALRKAVPVSPNVRLRGLLPDAPVVRSLRESGSAAVRQAARDQLLALTGGSKLARLKIADHVYTYALTLVLEALATDEDWELLFRIWSESPGFMLIHGDHIRRQGERGQRYLATLFARRSTNPYATRLQDLAARALLETDEAAAADALERLVAKKKLTELERWATQSMIDELQDHPPSKRWSQIVLRAATANPTSDVGASALKVLSHWKDPKAPKRVVGAIDKSLSLAQACALLELQRDRSVVPILEKRLKALGPKAKGDRNRLEQCIRFLKASS